MQTLNLIFKNKIISQVWDEMEHSIVEPLTKAEKKHLQEGKIFESILSCDIAVIHSVDNVVP